jgi:hypothetical protein
MSPRSSKFASRRLVRGLHHLAAAEQLDAPALILDMAERQRPLPAPGDQPSRNRDGRSFQRLKIVEDGLGVMRSLGARRVRVQAQRARRRGFLEPQLADFDQRIG